MPKTNIKTKTPDKPRRKIGGLIKANGKETGTPFSEENQPSPEAKRAGWLRKKQGPQLIDAILALAFKGREDGALKKQAASYFGIDQKEITPEIMLICRQIEKAIQKADTTAFNSIMDRKYGKPKEKHELSGMIVTPIIEESKIDYSKLPDALLEAIANVTIPAKG